MPKEKLKKLHANLTKDGYDLPDYNTFEQDMADENKRSRLHKTLTADNYDLPDFQTFTSDMGFGQPSPSPAPEKKKATPSFGGFGNLVFKLASAGAKAQQQQTTSQQQNPKKNSGPSFAELENTLNEALTLGKELKVIQTDVNNSGTNVVGNAFGEVIPYDMVSNTEQSRQQLPAAQRKYQWAQQKIKYQSQQLQPEFDKLQADISKNFQQYFTKDGIIDTQKVLTKAGELSQQYGGGQNVKEVLAQRIREYAQFEQQKPVIEKTYETLVRKKFGKSPTELFSFTNKEATKIAGKYSSAFENERKSIESELKDYAQKLYDEKYATYFELAENKEQKDKAQKSYDIELNEYRNQLNQRLQQRGKEIEAQMKSELSRYGMQNTPSAEMMKQLQDLYQQAYKQVAEDDIKSKQLIANTLGLTSVGQNAKVGMAFVNGLNNVIASMGEGAASIGINNAATDWLRSFDVNATRYELPDPELSLKNILTDPMGTVATRVARQVGTQLPMIAATAVTRSPRIAAAMGWGSETFSLMGETYKEVLENTGNPAEARAKSMELLKTQAVMLPTYYFQANSLLKLGTGAKGVIANSTIDSVNDILQEEVQGFTQAGLAGRKFGSEEFFNTLGETLVARGGTGAVIGGIGKAYQTISEKAPNVQEQHLFGVVQNMGVEGAIKHLENLRSTGQISMKAFEQGVAKAKAMETSINSMKKLNIDEDAQLATVAFDGRLTELNKQLEAEPNASVKAAISGQIAAAKKEIADIQAGNGNYAIVQVNGGGKFAIPMTEVGAFIDAEQDNIADGTTLVQLKGSDAVTAFGGRLQQLNDMAAKNNNLLSKEQQAEVDEMMKAITEDDSNNTGLRTTEGTTTETTAEPVQQNATATQEQRTETGVQEEAAATGQPGATGAIAVQAVEAKKADIERRRIDTERRIKRKDLFSEGGVFANELGGSGVDSVPTNHREVNGIEFVEFSNPNTGIVDVIMTGTSDHDFVGYYRLYKNGKATDQWSSKFENQSRNKDNFKTMISGVQEMLPQGHQYTEKTSISTDGLRVWGQQLSRGYELQYNNDGSLVTNRVAINGDAIINELGISVNRGNFANISVTNIQDFRKVKQALLPYLEKFGLDSKNIHWETGTIEIDLPVLKSNTRQKTSQQPSQPIPQSQEAIPPITVLPRQQAAVEQQRNKEQTFVVGTKKPKTIAYENGERVVLDSSGNKLDPKKESTKQVLRQHAEAYQYDFGETVPDEAWPQMPMGPNDVARFIAENSNNPAEIAAAYQAMELEARPMSSKQAMIAEAEQQLGTVKVTMDAYAEFGDRNNMNSGIGRFRIDANARSLDQQAQEISWQLGDESGTMITPEDLAEYITDFPMPSTSTRKSKTAAHATAENRFLELTGIPLTPKVAEIASQQFAQRPTPQQLEAAFDYPVDVWAKIIDEEIDNLADYEQYEQQQRQEDVSATDAEQNAGTPGTAGENEGADTGAETQSDGSGRAPDGSQSPAGGTAGIKLQLIGNKGAAALDAAEGTTVRMDNLQVAKDMEAAGKDVATIRLATGWEKGVDGMWRYEINAVKLKSKLPDNPETVGDVVDDPQLLAAYPFLKDIQLYGFEVNEDENPGGQYDPTENAIIAIGDSKKSLRSVFAHEIQHAIQRFEGFAKGGTPSLFTDSTELSADQRLFVEGALAMPQAEALQRLDDMEASEVFSAEEAAQLREAVNAGPDALRALLNGAFDQYQRLAGEVEARNVQARMGMTAEQRRQTPLAATEDVARDRQIVMADTSSPAAFLTTASPAQLEQAGLLDDMIAKAQRALQQILPGVQMQVAETLDDYAAIVRANLQQAGQTDSAFVDKASTGSFGIYIPGVNKIVINKAAMKQHDRNTTGVHEVVHPIVTQAVNGNTFTLERLAETILTLQGKGIPGVDAAIDHAFNKGYQGKQTIYDELVTEFLTQVVAGKVDVSKIDKSLIDQVIDVINKVMELLGISYRIQNPGDLQRLSVAVNELFNSGDKTMLEGAIGKFKTAQQPAASLDAIPANQLNQKLRDYAARSLEVGKPKAQVATAIKNATLMSDEEVAAVVDAAERMVGTAQMQQPELPGLEALRETIVDFGREMRKAYKRGRQEGGSEAAQTFREYEQMRTRIRGMITDMLKTARKLGVLKDGDITPDLMAGIIRRLTNAKTSAGLLSVYDYLKQVLRDVNYDGKLNRANAMAGRIKNINRSKSYSKNAAVREAVRQFTNINPAKVSDIDAYLATAEKILNTVQGLSASAGVTTAATVRNESPSITLQEIQDYVEQQQNHLLQRAEDALIEQYADYVAMGIIDPAAMTLEEMQEMVNLIDAPTDGRATAAERMAVAEKKLEEMRKAVGYNQMGLDDAYTPGMTDSERKIVDNLRLIDVEKLNAQELAKLNDAINNIIINNDYHGAGEIAQVADAQQDAVAALEAIKKAGMEGKMGDISGKFKQALASKDLLLQFIYRLNKLTSDMQRFIGVHDIMKGYDKAMTLQDKAVKRIDDIKKQLRVKDIDSPLNRYRRGVYADVANNFGGTDAEIQAEFDRRKAWVKATAERLLSSKKAAERREGELVKQVYDELLEGAATLADVQAKMQPYNMAIVQEWQAIHAERKEYTKEHAEQYNNLMWEDVENYTSTKLKSVDGNKDADAAIDQFDKEFIARGLAHTLAGAKNKKIRAPQPPKGRILNFDFDTVQARAFYETNYDVEVANAIAKFKAILRHPDAEKIFGSTDNKNAVLDNVRATVLQQKGKNPPLNTVGRFAEEFEKQFLRRLQAAGARIALGSITQPLKQYPSVAINTLVNLGKDMPLFGRSIREHFKNQEALNRLYEQFNIGQRGATQAGYNKDVDFAGVDPASFNTGAAKASEVAGKVYDKVNETLLAPLQFADVRVARHSWLAYYMQDLKRQGRDITNINWDAEASAPSNEAAAYAEQMVSRTQNPNDPTSMAALFKERGALKLFVRALMPFSTFSTNMRMRFVNDVEKLTNGTPEAKKEGLQSLVATGIEQLAFNALKVYLIQALIQQPLVEALAKGFGIMGDDEEDDDNYKDPVLNTIWGGQYQSSDNLTKVLSNSVSDYFFSGLGSKVQLTGNYLMNKVYAALVDETYKDGKVSKNPDLYFMPGKLNDALFDPAEWGMYGIAVAKAMEAVQNADEAYGYTDLYYKDNDKSLVASEKIKTKKAPIPEEFQRAYLFIFLVNSLSLAGVGDAELSQINTKLKRKAEKKLEEQYGGREFKIVDEADKEVKKANQ